LQLGLTSIRHLAFHPRKRQVAVACIPDVQICDLESGKVVATLPVPRGADWVAWHPEGKTVAAAEHNGVNIYLWDEATGKQTQVLRGHKTGGIAVAFNYTGDLLASSAWEGVLRLWDPRTGQQLFSTPASMLIPRFSPDGRLAADMAGTRLRLWKVTPAHGYRTLVRPPAQGEESYYESAIRPDGRLLAAAMTDGVGFWDPHSGTFLDFLPLGRTNTVLFEPSGALLTSGRAGVLRWPIRTEVEGQRSEDGDQRSGLPNSDFRPLTSGRVRIGPPERLRVDGRCLAIARSRDGRVLAIARFQEAALCLHRERPNEPVPLLEHQDVRSIAVHRDGRLVATGSHNGLHVKVWEAQTGKFLKELPVGPWSQVSFSPDGRWLATGGGGCRLWAVGSWQEGPPTGGGMQGGFAFSADSKLLAVETGQGVIRLLDPDTGREYARLEHPNQERAGFLTFSPDGTQLVVSASGEGQPLHIWDLRALGQGLAEQGLPWELPGSPPPRTENGREPLHLEVQFNALLYERRGLSHIRAHEYAEAIADFEKALNLDAKRSLAFNELAWIYVTGPSRLRDAEKALPLALKAVDLAPKEWTYQNTLGVVYYRLGKYGKAIETLQNNLQNSKFHAHDLFFLAMSYQQLGDSAKARDCYDRANRWWKSQAEMSPNLTEELTAFRDEAEMLLWKHSKP
jgi:WD40 repeat protein/Flp pilus assembly protein TadD